MYPSRTKGTKLRKEILKHDPDIIFWVEKKKFWTRVFISDQKGYKTSMYIRTVRSKDSCFARHISVVGAKEQLAKEYIYKKGLEI